jgi:hypothetical protein
MLTYLVTFVNGFLGDLCLGITTGTGLAPRVGVHVLVYGDLREAVNNGVSYFAHFRSFRHTFQSFGHRSLILPLPFAGVEV